jgi:hypothetical protein
MTVFSISKLCISYRGGKQFFEQFRTLARQFDGVYEVAVVAAGEMPRAQRPGIVFASAPIRYLDETVGELHMFFDAARFQDRSPLTLVKQLARQLGIAIQAAAIQTRNGDLKAHMAGLEAEIHEHKLMERARGVIESRRLIPKGEGERLLKKVSAQSGKTLREVARGIVSSANKNPWKFRREFWA